MSRPPGQPTIKLCPWIILMCYFKALSFIFFNSCSHSSRWYLWSSHKRGGSMWSSLLNATHWVPKWKMERQANFRASVLSTAFSSLSHLDKTLFVGEPVGKQEKEGRFLWIQSFLIPYMCLHQKASLWAHIPKHRELESWGFHPRRAGARARELSCTGEWAGNRKLYSKAWHSLWRQIIIHLHWRPVHMVLYYWVGDSMGRAGQGKAY